MCSVSETIYSGPIKAPVAKVKQDVGQPQFFFGLTGGMRIAAHELSNRANLDVEC